MPFFRRPACLSLLVLAFVALAACSGTRVRAQTVSGVNVLTQHNDNGRSGANRSETVLNTATVNARTFGRLFSLPVDGFVYAQPLVVTGLSVAGEIRNVVFVATEHNSVYAFDADSPRAAYWQVNLGPSVPSVDIGRNYHDLVPEVGITATPVIDLARGAIYVAAKIKEPAPPGGRHGGGGTGGAGDKKATYVYRLHALDLATGAAKPGSPITITASVPGRGAGRVNGLVSLDALKHLNRPGLLLVNDTVYLAFGSHADYPPYHGWVLGYNADTLRQSAVWCVTPNGDEGAVWQAGQGLLADEAGDVFVVTGNGSFDVHKGGASYGNSIVRLSTAGGRLTPADSFTPYNFSYLNSVDLDLGASGLLRIPGTNYLVTGGKDGKLIVADKNALGGFDPKTDRCVQRVAVSAGHVHGTPVHYDSPRLGPLIYVWPEKDFLKAFSFRNGTIRKNSVSKSRERAPLGMPGGMLSVSCDGATDGTGIVWASRPYAENANPFNHPPFAPVGPPDGHSDGNKHTVPGLLQAFDANDLSRELWNSRQNAARDDVGMFAKFCCPTVANGKVYVGTFSNKVQVYGLLPQ